MGGSAFSAKRFDTASFHQEWTSSALKVGLLHRRRPSGPFFFNFPYTQRLIIVSSLFSSLPRGLLPSFCALHCDTCAAFSISDIVSHLLSSGGSSSRRRATA